MNETSGGLTMPTAEILTIGTEILLGEIQDTNTAYIARMLMNAGIDLFRTQTVGDNISRISIILREIMSRVDILIVTGGLGPTVDDPTRQAIADAFNLPLEFHPECWEEIQLYFHKLNRNPPENNKRQAYFPTDAKPIYNPVGTAPGICLEINQKTIICLPGVPKEMEFLMHSFVIPYLQQRWDLHEVIRSRTIHLSGIGEAQVDELLGEYETLSNPTVGLLAKNGVIDIRVAAKAETIPLADQMINNLIQEITPILDRHIFGYDQMTLSEIVTKLVKETNCHCLIISAGLDGAVNRAFINNLPNNLTIYEENSRQDACTLSDARIQWIIRGKMDQHPAELDITFLTKEYQEQFSRKYAGPPLNASSWAINMILDTMRRTIQDHIIDLEGCSHAND